MRVNLFTTIVLGGTAEKVYGRGAGVRDLSFPPQYTFREGETATRLLLETHGVESAEGVHSPLKFQDSLDMTDMDREMLARVVNTLTTLRGIDRFLIVHGTDTMNTTAGFLDEQNLGSTCTIVFTGALVPHSMKESDFEFNLGAAVVAVQILPPGIYIVMHGNVYAWNECRKNPRTGRFERRPYYEKV